MTFDEEIFNILNISTFDLCGILITDFSIHTFQFLGLDWVPRRPALPRNHSYLNIVYDEDLI